MDIENLKRVITTVSGVIGGGISYLLGGLDSALQTLMIFMAVDFISGLALAAVFKKSPKSETGALKAEVGWKGLMRKGMTLAVVLVAHQIDLTTGTVFVRDTVIVAYIVNEAVSILENAGLMGVPMVKPLQDALDLLKKKEVLK